MALPFENFGKSVLIISSTYAFNNAFTVKDQLGQFNYKNAIENYLPIGSGEVESSHRYVIQDRLKIAGAWWKEKNADYMLALKTLRANDNWESYWEIEVPKAA